MEEADKVSSSAPDEAPRDVAMNEAAAVGPTQTDARGAEEEMTGETSPPQTTEKTSPPKITEETSASKITEETSIPQITEVTSSPQTIEKTSDPQKTEITSAAKIPEETSPSQTTKKTSDTQTNEVTSSPLIIEVIDCSPPLITEVIDCSPPLITEVIDCSPPLITEVIDCSPPLITEVIDCSPPLITEVIDCSPPLITEVTSSPEPAEESVALVSEVPVKRTSTEAGVTATDPVITDAAVTPEPAEEAVTPQTAAAEPTSPPRTEAREKRVSSSSEEKHPRTLPASREDRTLPASPSHEPELPAALPAAPALLQPVLPSALELLYWRDLRSSALVFGSSLFILLSLTCCSIISVLAYAALALLSITLTFRIYKGVLQAVQKSDEGHPFKWVLEKDVAVSSDAVQRHGEAALSRINAVLKELRRLFLVEDLIDSLKFAALLWVFTYVGAWFNGLTLLILGLVGAFSGPLTYEKHQTQIDQFISLVTGQMKDVLGKIQAMVPGAKKKPE